MRARTQLRSLLPGALLMLFLVLVVSLDTWDVAVTRPWAGMNSDHFVIGSMYHKNIDPNLFQRDFVISDQNAYSFYTPSFLFLVETIAKTFTDGQFIKAVALLRGPILIAFLLAATLLYWHVSDSLLVGFILALVSASGMESLKTFWDVIGLHAMLPRTVAMPVLMLATYTFFRTYEPDNREKSWLWIATGLLIGIVSNLHPPTGMVFATTVGIACLPVWFKHGRRQLLSIGLLVAGVTLTGLPILLSVLDAGTDGGVPITDFQAYAEVFQLRVAMFPFRPASGRHFSPTRSAVVDRRVVVAADSAVLVRHAAQPTIVDCASVPPGSDRVHVAVAGPAWCLPRGGYVLHMALVYSR